MHDVDEIIEKEMVKKKWWKKWCQTCLNCAMKVRYTHAASSVHPCTEVVVPRDGPEQ